MDGFSDAVSITAVSTMEKAPCGALFQLSAVSCSQLASDDSCGGKISY